MADLIKRELGLDTLLVAGRPAEFRVLVDGRVVARKLFFRFPSDQKVLDRVRSALLAREPATDQRSSHG